MKLRNLLSAALATSALMFASIAAAAPTTVNLTFNGAVSDPVTGNITWTGDPVVAPRSAQAAKLGFTVTAINDGDIAAPFSVGDKLEAFCVELGIQVGSGLYTLHHGSTFFADLGKPSAASDLGKLFRNYYSLTGTDRVLSAAFQLAVWEIVYDSPMLDILAGNFIANGTFSGARAIADGWLASLSDPGLKGMKFYVLASENRQDIAFIPVPEPGMLLLIGSGLLFGVGLRRRIRA